MGKYHGGGTTERCAACGATATIGYAENYRCSSTQKYGFQCNICGCKWHVDLVPGRAAACPQCGNKYGFRAFQ